MRLLSTAKYIPMALSKPTYSKDEDKKLPVQIEPILKFPHPNLTFDLCTDGCTTGIGEILMQEIDGLKWPICYVSRKLLDRETRYSVSELEILAIVFCVIKLRYYLEGRTFIIETDHNALTFLNQRKADSGRLTRWSLILNEFSYFVEYIKGNENTSDYLSRSFET